MIKRNEMKNRRRMTWGILAAVILLCLIVPYAFRRWQKEHTGIPDAVSSTSDGSGCRLTVVANCDKIKDREEFAWEVIEMCRNNSFHTIRLSTDISGWPASLDIAVYLHKADIGVKEEVMRIRYEPRDNKREYDIKNDADKYELIIE
nr:hypothetical protein [uncultured Mediterraneibacter sp.]